MQEKNPAIHSFARPTRQDLCSHRGLSEEGKRRLSPGEQPPAWHALNSGGLRICLFPCGCEASRAQKVYGPT